MIIGTVDIDTRWRKLLGKVVMVTLLQPSIRKPAKKLQSKSSKIFSKIIFTVKELSEKSQFLDNAITHALLNYSTLLCQMLI